MGCLEVEIKKRGCLQAEFQRLGERLQVSFGVVCSVNRDRYLLLSDGGYLLLADGGRIVLSEIENKSNSSNR